MPAERVTVPAVGEGMAARTVARLPGGKRLSPLKRVAVAAAVSGLLVLVAILTRPWGFVILGSAVGMLVVAGVPAARAALQPAAALCMSGLPLLLPLLVFVAAGVVTSPLELQFTAGLVTLLLGWTLARPDYLRLRAALRRQPRYRSLVRGLTQVGVPLLIGAIALAFLARSILDLLSGSDELARTLFVLALGALAFAVVLRVLGYGRTAFRALVALALLALLARLAVEAGLIGDEPLGRLPLRTYVQITAGLLALAALAEVMTALLGRDAASQSGAAADELPLGIRTAVLLETPVAARWVTDRMGVAGYGFSLLSAVLLLGAVLAASLSGGAQEDLDTAPRAGQPRTRPADLADAPLAAMYAPVLLFTADQRWTPIAVDDYVRGATATDWEGRRSPVGSSADLGTKCPGVVPVPCFTLRQHCPGGDQARCAQDLPDDPAVYVRVARKAQWSRCPRSGACADGSPDPFARPRGPFAAATTILVQYWFFYPYNEWSAPVAIGDLKEVHAADWEAVTVGLSEEEPLWVAYSAHCAGSYARWSQVRAAPADPAHLRPLVAVAEGSQANYRLAKQTRVPNFAECSGITNDRLMLASYAANIRDRTDDAVTWTPGPGDLRFVDATEPPMSFAGTWAPSTLMRLETAHRSIPLGAEGRGPASPPLQPLWQRPMRAIFGGGAWIEG